MFIVTMKKVIKNWIRVDTHLPLVHIAHINEPHTFKGGFYDI